MKRIAVCTSLLLALSAHPALAQLRADGRADMSIAERPLALSTVSTTNWRPTDRHFSRGRYLRDDFAPTAEVSGAPKGLVGAMIGAVIGGGFVYAVARGACEGTHCSSATAPTLAGAAIGAVLGAAIEFVARR